MYLYFASLYYWMACFCFFLLKKSSQNAKSKNDTTVINSSYITPIENPSTTSYKEIYSDTSITYQNTTTSNESNPYSQNKYDYEENYFLGE